MNTILFVDDEQNILSFLKRLLHNEPWKLFFAGGGQEGFDILDKEEVDLVISDVQMPEMDGIVFMRQVKERYPHIVRIFMSGHADRSAVAKALSEGCAQQILSKPCNEAELKEVIHDALQQTAELKKKNTGLQKVINSLSSLSPMPETYLEIKKCLSHINTVSTECLAEIIEQDASVSAELLRWANSSFFGQMHKVDTIERALMILGMDIIEGLILSHAVFGQLSSDQQKVQGFSLKAFQTHSLACAILSKLLVTKLAHMDPKDADRAFTAGLLHDVGKLVEQRYLTEKFIVAVDAAHENKTLLVDAEYQILETTHEEIGRHLAEWWSMPSFLVNTIRWHHNPKMCKADQPVVQAVHMADVLVQKFGIGESGNFRVPIADKAYMEFFEILEEDLPSIKEAVIYYLS